VSGTSATISGSFELQAGGSIEYRYDGTVSDTTYSGTVTLSDGTAQEQGQFSVTRGGGGPTPTPTPTPGDSTISGTVSSAGGEDVIGTTVVACTPDLSACDYGIAIEQAGASASYTIPVPSGDYAVLAAQDTNGDGELLNEGDLLGVYTTDGTNPAVVTAPATGIDITMAPITATQSNRLGPQLLKGMERSLQE
jgi:hypothetical protein